MDCLVTGNDGLPALFEFPQECKDSRVLIACPWPQRAACSTEPSHLLYISSQKTLWPWTYILKPFLCCRYFLWNGISPKKPSANRGHSEELGGTVAQMSLCVALWVLHHLQPPGPGLNCCRVWREIPVAHLTLYWTHLIFISSPKLLLAPSQFDAVPGAVRPLGSSLTSPSRVSLWAFSALDRELRGSRAPGRRYGCFCCLAPISPCLPVCLSSAFPAQTHSY